MKNGPGEGATVEAGRRREEARGGREEMGLAASAAGGQQEGVELGPWTRWRGHWVSGLALHYSGGHR